MEVFMSLWIIIGLIGGGIKCRRQRWNVLSGADGIQKKSTSRERSALSYVLLVVALNLWTMVVAVVIGPLMLGEIIAETLLKDEE